MILVIIIVVRGESMLQRALGVDGRVVPGADCRSGFADLSADAWRVLVGGHADVRGDDLASQLRHFVLLPSCVALIGGIMLMM
jgi:hypothetical protein